MPDPTVLPITITLTDDLKSNAPTGTLIATCATVIDSPIWTLDASTASVLSIDSDSGDVTSTSSPLPRDPMTLAVIATSPSDSTDTLSMATSVPLTQMPDFRSLALDPNTLLSNSASGTVVGTLTATIPVPVDPNTVTYTLTSQSNSGALSLSGNEISLGKQLTAGTYTATIELDAPLANQSASFDVTVTINDPPPAPTVQQQALALLGNPTVTVECASLPALDGDYAADVMTRGNITGIAVAINGGLGLPSGSSTFNYPDKNGQGHPWPADQFLAFAHGVMVYIYDLSQVAGGNGTSLPDPTISIA